MQSMAVCVLIMCPIIWSWNLLFLHNKATQWLLIHILQAAEYEQWTSLPPCIAYFFHLVIFCEIDNSKAIPKSKGIIYSIFLLSCGVLAILDTVEFSLPPM